MCPLVMSRTPASLLPFPVGLQQAECRLPLHTLRTRNEGSERVSDLPETAQRLGGGANIPATSAQLQRRLLHPATSLCQPRQHREESRQRLSPPVTPPVEPLWSAQLRNVHLVCCRMK